MSGDPEQEYFSDGMAEEIITALSKVPYLLVIARNSTFTYKGKTINIKQVGKELGAKYVLEGSVRKAGNRLRVTAQLIDAASGNHIWADRYDRDLKDIFELQDEITARILSELKLRIDFDLRTKVSIKYTDNLEAYLRWWQGSSHLSRLNKDDNALARKLFKEVVQLDPNWAVGYSHLGIVSIMDYMGGWCCSPDKCIEEAITYAKKANSLDNTNPDPYAILSYVMLVKKQYDEAIAEAEKAISVEPGFFYGYNSLGIALLYSGKPEKAFETFKKALSLNPKQNVWFQCNFGLALCHLGRYIEAIDLLKTAIRKMPFYILSHACLTASYILAGMKDEARKQAKEILRIDPNFSVDNFADRIPYKNQSDTDRILNALRKAGLK
jgi:adenylate cyclase